MCKQTSTFASNRMCATLSHYLQFSHVARNTFSINTTRCRRKKIPTLRRQPTIRYLAIFTPVVACVLIIRMHFVTLTDPHLHLQLKPGSAVRRLQVLRQISSSTQPLQCYRHNARGALTRGTRNSFKKSR